MLLLLNPDKDPDHGNTPGHGHREIDQEDRMGCDPLSATGFFCYQKDSLEHGSINGSNQNGISNWFAGQARHLTIPGAVQQPGIYATEIDGDQQGQVFEWGFDDRS